jgi:hypothetical protein
MGGVPVGERMVYVYSCWRFGCRGISHVVISQYLLSYERQAGLLQEWYKSIHFVVWVGMEVVIFIDPFILAYGRHGVCVQEWYTSVHFVLRLAWKY